MCVKVNGTISWQATWWAGCCSTAQIVDSCRSRVQHRQEVAALRAYEFGGTLEKRPRKVERKGVPVFAARQGLQRCAAVTKEGSL